jgi:alpha,alpha-trehalase
MDEKDVSKQVIEYIKKDWKKPSFIPSDQRLIVGLPNKFISPNKKIFNKDQFYWDSYFIVLGLVELNKINLAKGMVENLAYLFNKFKIIPARNRFYNLGISQPPFLTSMAFEIFEKTKDKEWLSKIMKTAEKELLLYWKSREVVEHHLVTLNLSRYCDHNITHDTAEQESGWDMTSRFKFDCLNYLPVDLNACLYKYEKDLEKFYLMFRKKKKAEFYERMAEKRKEEMIDLMWSERRGFFFDYNYNTQKRSTFYSLAGYYPLWAGMITNNEMRKRMQKKLKLFEFKGGLANTQKRSLTKKFRQWDYPNGWPNQQYIVIDALRNNGFKKYSIKLTKKWLDLNNEVFEETGKLWEKYDVVHYAIGKDGRYKTQEGFGWTNGVYLRLLKQYLR